MEKYNKYLNIDNYRGRIKLVGLNNEGKALNHQERLNEIVIPDDVEIIGINAFADCLNLKNLKF